MKSLSPAARIAINLIAFQVFWLAMTLATGAGRANLCWPLAAASIALNLALSTRRVCDARFFAACACLGWCIDLALTRAGVFNAGPWPPLWLLAFWLNFATLPRTSLRWLAGRPVMAAVLGAIGGPLAYWSASRLGAIAFHADAATSLCILAAVWMLMTPIYVWLGGLLPVKRTA